MNKNNKSSTETGEKDGRFSLSKELELTFRIINFLNKNHCTLQETEKILSLIKSQNDYQRERYEYVTLENYFKRNKIHNADNDIIEKLN